MRIIPQPLQIKAQSRILNFFAVSFWLNFVFTMTKKKSLIISAEAKSGKAQIRIVGVISNWRNSADQFEEAVERLIAEGIKDVDLYVRTPGGSCFEAAEIHNIIKRFPGTIEGTAGAVIASAGTYILCAASKRRGPKNINYMVHRPSGFLEGTADQIEADLKLLKNLEAEYLETYSKVTGKDKEFIEKNWKNDWWMNAKEALKHGFITEIIEEDTAASMEEVESVQKTSKNVPQALLTIQQTQTEPDMKGVYACLGIADDKQSEGQAIAQIETLKAKAAKAEAAEKELATVKAEAAKAKADAVLDNAIATKRILPSEREFFAKNLLADFDGTKKVIEARTPVTKLSGEVKPSSTGAEDRSKWTFADYQDKNPDALAELHANDPDKFEELYNAHYKIK